MKSFMALGDGGQAVLQAQALLGLKTSSMAVESKIRRHRKAARECLKRFKTRQDGSF
jgi:hypothetical protein